MAAAPVFAYAAIFVLVNIAYLAFECEALSLAETRAVSNRVRKIRRARAVFTLAIFWVPCSYHRDFHWAASDWFAASYSHTFARKLPVCMPRTRATLCSTSRIVALAFRHAKSLF